MARERETKMCQDHEAQTTGDSDYMTIPDGEGGYVVIHLPTVVRHAGRRYTDKGRADARRAYLTTRDAQRAARHAAREAAEQARYDKAVASGPWCGCSPCGTCGKPTFAPGLEVDGEPVRYCALCQRPANPTPGATCEHTPCEHCGELDCEGSDEQGNECWQ